MAEQTVTWGQGERQRRGTVARPHGHTRGAGRSHAHPGAPARPRAPGCSPGAQLGVSRATRVLPCPCAHACVPVGTATGGCAQPGGPTLGAGTLLAASGGLAWCWSPAPCRGRQPPPLGKWSPLWGLWGAGSVGGLGLGSAAQGGVGRGVSGAGPHTGEAPGPPTACSTAGRLQTPSARTATTLCVGPGGGCWGWGGGSGLAPAASQPPR